LRTVIGSLSKDADIVVAYEPVWAIGSGEAATPGEAQEVCAALRETLQEVMGEPAAERTRILYGGSVKSQNIASFMREKDVDGALVGSASIDVDEFSRIIQFPKHIIA
jgi:triosephosphate isomerase